MPLKTIWTYFLYQNDFKTVLFFEVVTYKNNKNCTQFLGISDSNYKIGLWKYVEITTNNILKAS